MARIRVRHKEYVDDFLAEHFAQSDIRRRVLVATAEEDIFTTLGGGTGPWVGFITTTLHSDAFREDLMWIARTAAESKNLNQVLKSVVKWGINQIYGGSIFQV